MPYFVIYMAACKAITLVRAAFLLICCHFLPVPNAMGIEKYDAAALYLFTDARSLMLFIDSNTGVRVGWCR